TSREPLRDTSEYVWTLAGLSLPPRERVGAPSVKASEAGKLLLQRAAATDPEFRLTEAVAPAVAEICWRLDGMPLAIEFAESLVASQSVEEIAAGLDGRFHLLDTYTEANVDPRHRTLGAVLEWSHELLTPAEALLFRRACVFPSFTLAAAEEVCALDEAEKDDVLEHLGGLVNKSLVVVQTGSSPRRYRQLEIVREWAARKLTEAGEARTLRRRHLLWCLAQTEHDAGAPPLSLPELDAEHDNFLAALNWASETAESEPAVRLATNLSTFWRLHGHAREGVRWLEWAVSAGDETPPPLHATAVRQLGLLRAMVGDTAEAVSLLGHGSELFAEAAGGDTDMGAGESMHMVTAPRQSLTQIQDDIDRCRPLDDRNQLSHLLSLVGQGHYFVGQLDDAHRSFAECLQIGRDCSDGKATRAALLGLAGIALARGDYAKAEARVEEARPLADHAGDIDDIAVALGMLGDLARARGDWGQSRQLLDRSVALARADGGPSGVGRALHLRAQLTEWEDGQLDYQAQSMLEEALSLSRLGRPLGFLEARCLLGLGSAAEIEGDLGAADRLYREAGKCAGAGGDVQARADADDRRGGLARAEGRTDQALTLVHRGLELHDRIGEVAAVAASLEAVAGLAAEGGSAEAAARLFGAVQTLRDARGYARSKRQRVRHAADLATARWRLTPQAFMAVWAKGASLSVDEAVSVARRGRGPRRRPPAGWESLTPSELDVALLLGEELSNPEVGRRLVMGTRTVEYHLGNVYRKLGIHSRGALKAALAAGGPIGHRGSGPSQIRTPPVRARTSPIK
ncbi:MAG TPA: LuxR C-terminal-related transcriptional regulator, partial [Acidimicrobiales bacterium]